MKKQGKRIFTLILAAALFLMTVACSANETSSQSSNSEEESQISQESSSDDIVTLTAFFSAPDAYDGVWKWGDDPTTSYITEQTGVTLDISYATSSNHQEFYTMLASGVKMPDLVYLGKLEPQLINEGYALPMNKLADEYCPEFYELMPYQYDEIYTYEDGNIYFLAQGFADTKKLATLPGGVKGWTSFTHNRILREELGNPSLETLDDVEAAAKKAKENGSEYPVFLTLNLIYYTEDYDERLNELEQYHRHIDEDSGIVYYVNYMERTINIISPTLVNKISHNGMFIIR